MPLMHDLVIRHASTADDTKAPVCIFRGADG
jgi:hypothetical protein